MQPNKPAWHTTGFPLLLEQHDLPSTLMREAMHDLIAGQFDESAAAVLLTALRMKGEAPHELAAAVEVLRTKMTPIVSPRRPVLDTCGTGGDGSGTFNISTAVALVLAACGIPVVKHGNRSVSSRSGSADVLQALGVPIEAGCAWSQTTLDELGFAFCFAPHFHPALANVGPLRRKLGFRTIFNLLGPLLNPAGAEHQLLGVGHARLLDPMAQALALLGTKQAFVVCGSDGLDEVTLAGVTMVRWVRAGQVTALEWQPSDFGLPSIDPAALRADGPQESAQILTTLLAGASGPARLIVQANVAAGLLAVDQVRDLRAGVQRAGEVIDSGLPRNLLERLRASGPTT